MKKIFTLAAAVMVAMTMSAQTTLFAWSHDGSTAVSVDETNLNAEGMGSMTVGTSVVGRLFGENEIGGNKKGYKLGNNDVCIEIQGTEDFIAGDSIIVTGICGGSGERSFSIAASTVKSASSATLTTTTQEDKSNVLPYYAIITANEEGTKLRVFRLADKTMYLKSITVIRPEGVTPSTDPVLKVSAESVDMNLTAAETSMSESVTFSGKNLTAGTYNLTVPSVTGMTVSPTSVTVGADGKLNAEVTISYTSTVDVAAATASISLTIGELTKSVTVNYSAVMEKQYISSINIEGLVVENGKSYDIQSALDAAHFDYKHLDELDSLNNAKGNGRNEAYLGLKIKSTGGYIAGWLKAGSTLRVKFGNLPDPIKVTLNGVAAADHESGVYEYSATADTYVKLATSSANTVVFKQIMVDAEITDVMYKITYAESTNGETTGWTVAFAGEKVVVKPTPAEGYKTISLKWNGNALYEETPGAELSFTMPATDVEVVSVFGTDFPSAIDNAELNANATKVIRNGQLVIEKNGMFYNAQGSIIK